jgi:ABC-type tungstate transport system substrate-binding protein
VITVFALFWISLLYFVVRFKFSTLKRWSKNVTEIYMVHWVILGILYYLVISNPLNIWAMLILTAAVLLVSDLIAHLYLKFKANYLSNKQNA